MMVKFRYWLSSWLFQKAVNVIPDPKVRYFMASCIMQAGEMLESGALDELGD